MKTINKSFLLEDLANGMSRQQMCEKYEITLSELKSGMETFGLKNAKAKKKKATITFVNDIDAPVEENVRAINTTPEITLASAPVFGELELAAHQEATLEEVDTEF